MVEVHCGKCGKWMDERRVEFVNIEENRYGRDRLTFYCPYCGSREKSLRRVR